MCILKNSIESLILFDYHYAMNSCFSVTVSIHVIFGCIAVRFILLVNLFVILHAPKGVKGIKSWILCVVWLSWWWCVCCVVLCVCVCMCKCMCAHTNVRVFVCLCVYAFVCVCMRLCVCVCVCVYVCARECVSVFRDVGVLLLLLSLLFAFSKCVCLFYFLKFYSFISRIIE